MVDKLSRKRVLETTRFFKTDQSSLLGLQLSRNGSLRFTKLDRFHFRKNRSKICDVYRTLDGHNYRIRYMFYETGI